MDWESLRAACEQCRKCDLCNQRNHMVFGVGPRDAEILFVGEGPGQQEDLLGEPFVGAAGRFLDDMLSIIGLGRHNCYIANIVKCRPPQNRDPLPIEQEACLPWLRMQTKLLRPKLIVCLGRIAAAKLIREDFKITREHGQWIEKGGIWFTALYHPSAFCATRASVLKRFGISSPCRLRYAPAPTIRNAMSNKQYPTLLRSVG